MTSSTAPSSRLRSLGLCLAVCATAWGVTCATGEWLSRFAETELGAHLWRGEEWMQLLSRARYTRRVADRVLVIGPSEAREAFWEAPFREVLPGVFLANDALSMSTLEDGLSQLEYIERAYGAGALGGRIVVAVTHRWVVGYTPGTRPFPIVVDRYSSRFALDESVEPQALVEKNAFEGALARLRLAAHSGGRYRAAIAATRVGLEARLFGGSLEDMLMKRSLVGSRFFDREPRDKQQYYEAARAGEGQYAAIRGIDPRLQREAILREFARLREIAARSGTRVIVVNMPEGGWVRESFYDPGIHEAYMRVLREALGELPFLDLREALPDDGFFDWSHPTHESGLQLSRMVAEELRRLDSR